MERKVFIGINVIVLMFAMGQSAFGATLTFQDGLGGYTGTQDTWLEEKNPTHGHGTEANINIDEDTTDSIFSDKGARTQGLIRFDNLVGGYLYEGGSTAYSRIPYGSTINSATISFYNTNTSSHVSFAYINPMLTGWTESSTWSSMGNGVQTNDAEAASTRCGTLVRDKGWQTYDIKSTVQGWAAGNANNGLLLDATSNFWSDNGMDYCSSDNATQSNRPKLVVDFTPRVYNAAPVVNELSLSSLTINEGQSVTIKLKATDPSNSGANQGSVDTVYFYIDGVEIGSAVGTGTQSRILSFDQDGVYTFHGQARDNDNAWSGIRDITLRVLNVAPTITGLTGDLTVERNAPFVFGASATDPGVNDKLSFSWDMDGDGVFDDLFDAGSKNWTLGENGIHTFQVKVTDNAGASDIKSFSVNVVPEPTTILFLLASSLCLLPIRQRAR